MNKKLNLTTEQSPLRPAWIYKIFTAQQWQVFEKTGEFVGAPIDLQDGFVHLSDAQQVSGTLARHFAGQTDLFIAAFDPADLGDTLKWEVSRGGALFPHLYGPLVLTGQREVWRAYWRGEDHRLEKVR